MISSRRTLLAGAVAALAVGPGCHRKDRDVTKASDEATTLPGLAREVGLKFPSSARLIGVGRESGIDDMVRFKVEIDPHDLAAFLATSPVAPEAFEPGAGGLLGPDQAFWDPSHAVRLRTGQAVLKNQRALNIGIDDGRPQVVVLYVVNHGT